MGKITRWNFSALKCEDLEMLDFILFVLKDVFLSLALSVYG